MMYDSEKNRCENGNINREYEIEFDDTDVMYYGTLDNGEADIITMK